MFKCKTCASHKDHIESLKAQIADLRRLTLPNVETPKYLPLVDLDTEQTTQESSDATAQVQTKQEEIDAEAARLLSGTY